MTQLTIPTESEDREVFLAIGRELKNGALHCRPKDLFTIRPTEQYPSYVSQPLELYLANFAKPIRTIANETRCLACNHTLTAPQTKYIRTDDRLLIDFEDLHLEGRCGQCGYPVRCRHYVNTNETPPRLAVRLDFFPLCYHPNALGSRH